jgi:hypothetical protein
MGPIVGDAAEGFASDGVVGERVRMAPSRGRVVGPEPVSPGMAIIWRRAGAWFARLSRAERIFIGLVMLCYT